MSAVTPRRVLPWSGRSVFCALAPVALTTFVVLGPLRAPVAGSDEGLLLVHPDSVARGEVPNRDFATVYGPMTYWLLAGVYRLLGHTLVVERSVGVAYRVAIAVAVVLLLRRSVHPVAASLAGLTSLLLASVHFPLAYAYHGALASALIGLCLLTTQRDTVRFVGGLVLGLAAAFRPEMGILSLASVPLLVRTSWRWPLAGWGLGLLPLLTHLVTGGRAVLDDVLLGRAGVNSQVGPPGLVLLAAALGVVVCAVVLWVVGRRCGEPALVALGVTGILLVPNMVQRLDLHHVSWPASVVVSATVAVMASRSPWLQEGPVRLVPVLSAAAFAAVLGVPALVHGSPVVEHAGRSIHVAPEQLRPTRAVLATVDAVSTPDDVVFVGAQDLSEPVLPSSWLYHLLPAHPRPFRYEEFLPGRTEQAGSGLLEDLRSADVLVLEDLDLLGDHLTPYVPRGPQTANQLVQREFCPVARHGDAVVMVRRDRCERARDATGAAGPVVPRPPSGAVVRQ